jgi:hypothetical protein
MLYKKVPVLAILLLLCFTVWGQSKKADTQAIKATIDQFFVALSSGDTTLLKSTCMSSVTLHTIRVKKDGTTVVDIQPFSDFVRLIGTPTQDKYVEKIKYEKILIEQQLASVWTPYSFFINEKLSHCGTNSLQLVHTQAGWKIQYIIDTRRKMCK